jgi:hypothetical protein
MWVVIAQNCAFVVPSFKSTYIMYIYIYGLKICREDNRIKMYLKEIGLGWDVDVIYVAQNSSRCWAVVSTAINFRVPQNVRNFLNI